MIDPSINELMENIDSRYTLAILTAKRARLITAGSDILASNCKSDKAVSIAVNEIYQHKVTYARKPKEDEYYEVVDNSDILLDFDSINDHDLKFNNELIENKPTLENIANDYEAPKSYDEELESDDNLPEADENYLEIEDDEAEDYLDEDLTEIDETEDYLESDEEI